MPPQPDIPKTIHVADDLPELCMVGEIAQFFRIGDEQVKGWLREKDETKQKLPNAFKVQGNRWRIPRSDVIALAHSMYGNKRG